MRNQAITLILLLGLFVGSSFAGYDYGYRKDYGKKKDYPDYAYYDVYEDDYSRGRAKKDSWGDRIAWGAELDFNMGAFNDYAKYGMIDAKNSGYGDIDYYSKAMYGKGYGDYGYGYGKGGGYPGKGYYGPYGKGKGGFDYGYAPGYFAKGPVPYGYGGYGPYY
eukprot:Rmarinus@m.3207